jgi:hypothetical protein
MELTLKSLEALRCKNVDLGPGKRAWFATSGWGMPPHSAARMLGFGLISYLPRVLVVLMQPRLEDFGGRLYIHPSRFCSFIFKVDCLHSDATIQSWYQTQENKGPRVGGTYGIRYTVFFGGFEEKGFPDRKLIQQI